MTITPHENIADLEIRKKDLMNQINNLFGTSIPVNTAADSDSVSGDLAHSNDSSTTETIALKLANFEKAIALLTRELADVMAAIFLQQQIESEEMKKKEKEIARSLNRSLKNKGRRLVKIRFLNGTEIYIVMQYYMRNCDEKKQKKRFNCCYPCLFVLNIYDNCSFELASEISKLVVCMSSFQEAQEILASRGCKLNIKTIRNITKRFAARARLSQQSGRYACDMSLSGEGNRIVLSVDGGRLRERSNKRGPKTPKKRTRYHTLWREPKLFCIYVVDKNGRVVKDCKPIIDGSLDDCEATFKLMIFYLKQLNISEKDSILFVADGATWIWNRVNDIAKELNLKENQMHQLLDFYHAVEHLNVFAQAQTGWSNAQKKKWVSTQRFNLKNGNTAKVIASIKSASVKTQSTIVKTEKEYFLKNESRMQYAKIAQMGFPMGSGAMESTIRRVINLRLKGPGIFWLKETANEIILLRSYYKAKRWEQLEVMAAHEDILNAA